jgi:cell division septation protein DedD
MTRSQLDVNLPENPDTPKAQRRFHIDLSGTQVFFCALCALVVLSWMFIFGILIGRGLPMVDSKDVSYRAEFFRFIGLGEEEQRLETENAAETWESPQQQQERQKKILESLNYYEDLSQKGSSIPQSTPATPPVPASQPPATKDKTADQAAKSKAKQPSPTAQRQDGTAQGSQKTASQQSAKEQDTPDNSSEHFTLLIASLRDGESARKLVDQLRSKGYNARLEPLDASGGTNWNRVLLGSFPNREGALRFAAEFNRRERMEGLVIRESR